MGLFNTKTLVILMTVISFSTAWAADELPAVSHDGLMLVKDSKADVAYILPEAEFAPYDRFMILEPAVAFRKNWERDFNRSSTRRVRDSDMQRIKTGMAELFLEVVTQELQESGYAIVEEPGEDVMLLRPAIVNLDVTAPDLRSASRTRTYVASAGSASLYIELYDSISGQILARAIDSKEARDHGSFRWATAASNRSEARKMLRRWAEMLVERLEAVREN